MTVEWKWCSWSELTKQQLYDVLKLRQEIFVIEQGCIYQQLDDFDQVALHLLVVSNGEIVGHGRAFPPGTKKSVSCLSGICVAGPFRGRGIGEELLKRRLEYLRTRFPMVDIFSSVQQYRVPVYEALGFRAETPPYIIEGEQYLGEPIYHVDMLLKA